MTFIKKFKDFKMRRKEQIRTEKCFELVKVIRNYKEELPEKSFFGESLYIDPYFPSDILEPVVNYMGFCVIEQRDFFENDFRYLLNQPSHVIVLKKCS